MDDLKNMWDTADALGLKPLLPSIYNDLLSPAAGNWEMG